MPLLLLDRFRHIFEERQTFNFPNVIKKVVYVFYHL